MPKRKFTLLIVIQFAMLLAIALRSETSAGQDESALQPNVFLPTIFTSADQMVFVSDRDGNEEIYLMESDGSTQVRLTDNPVRD